MLFEVVWAIQRTPRGEVLKCFHERLLITGSHQLVVAGFFRPVQKLYFCGMATLHSFTFNPFYENTYIVFDDSRECVIIDPGCLLAEEQEELKSFIVINHLKPVRLLNTHCHVDHVFGNRFVADTWQLGLEFHALDLPVLDSFPQVTKMYGFPGDEQPKPARFIESGETIAFGNTALQVIFAPGHSPGHVCFYCAEAHFLVGGDVLFRGSVGRTDLPGGDADTLLNSIRTQLFTLPENVVVHPGHGPETTIGEEKRSNPFAGEAAFR